MDYRDRIYRRYITSCWCHTHSLEEKEYELFAAFSKKTYNNILPRNKQAAIIDIACGGGHFLHFLQKEGYTNARGIDCGEEQLEAARKAGVRNLEKADLFEYLPAHAALFDMIVANDIIEHLGKDETLRFLDLIYNSLKPGGIALISTVNAQSLFGSAVVFVDFTHEQGFTPTSLSQVMRVCNFEDVRVFGEKPAAHDIRSFFRSVLWTITKKILRIYLVIESGTGRGCWKNNDILEPRMFAVGCKHAP